MAAAHLDEHRLHRLLEVGRGLVAELSLEAVLQQVLEVARELTGARYAALGVLDERKEGLARFLTLGMGEEARAEIGDLPRGRGVLGELIRHPEPLRLQDVGVHPRSYGFPPGHPPMRSFLGVPIAVRGEAWGNLYLTEKEGGDFDEADEASVVVLGDWAAIAIANARLYEGQASRRMELERAVRALEASTAIAQAVGGETELGRVLELIAKRGRALVDARWLAIMLEEGEELVVAATAGAVGPELAGRRLPVEGSVAGQVLRANRAERVPDLSNRLMAVQPDDMGVVAETAMFVPLSFRGKAVGVLLAVDREVDGPDFSGEDQRLMAGFAASAATAVATAKSVAADRLRQSLQAAEQERNRWARELHDETLQALGGLRVLLSSALQREAPDAVRQAATTAVDLIEGEIVNLSSIISELRPASLDEIGLQAAVEGLAERTSALRDLEASTNIDLAWEAGRAPTRLTPEVETTAYRLIQEALNNVAKHAGAERVSLEVSESGDELLVEVRDDGKGFAAETAAGGFGLLGMRERVELCGGDVRIESSPGAGATVSARLPAQHRPDEGLPATRAKAG